MVQHAGKVLTHKFLLNQLWSTPIDPQYLRVYVRQLRDKIEPDPARPHYILTETGVGYRLRARLELPMKISDFLSPAHVMLDVRASDKSRLLHQLSTQAAVEVGLDAAEVSKQIAKREALGSTGVGNGVALPHARLKGLKSPFGLLARLHHGIDFEAIDDQPVDIVFLLLLPDAPNDAQLNALACAARALRGPEVLERVRGANDREAIFRAVTGGSPD